MGSFGKFSKGSSRGGGGGGGTPGGSNTQVQFNDAGAFGGDAGLTYTKATDELDVGILQIKGEQAETPADPGAGNGGFLYAKENGKVYWRSNDLAETDLTAGGTSVAGSDTQLQYNNGGSAGGTANLVYNDSTGYLGMGASGGDVTHRLTLPNTDGVGGRVKANAYVTYSSKRYKHGVASIQNPIELINKISGVTYKWNDSGRTDIGFIAEDVGKVLPMVVDYEKNGVDAIAMDYTRINAVLVEAVKDQNKMLVSNRESMQAQNKMLMNNRESMQAQNKLIEGQQKKISTQGKQLDKLVTLLGALTESQKQKFKEISEVLKGE